VTEPPLTVHAFFERARKGQLAAIKCGACGALAIPPKELCPECGARSWSVVPLGGEGTIASYTVIRVGPREHVGDTPYAIAAVRLAEGVSMLGRVVDIPLERLAIGLAVRFRPLVLHGHDAIGFGPA
jgi:uncharacterized OB-fold protein